MKCTEKIEVRVSLEEKQTLTRLAKQDGDSVSGLIRGLVEKYMALNSPDTIRKLPKWQIAASLALAAMVGHGLTLIPMYLHDRPHQSASKTPIYMIHGAIDKHAFGMVVQAEDNKKEVLLESSNENSIRVNFDFKPDETQEGGGMLTVSICEFSPEKTCEQALETEMQIDRVAPSALGNGLPSGKAVRIFVQEMA